MAFFGLKLGLDLEKKFQGVPPRGSTTSGWLVCFVLSQPASNHIGKAFACLCCMVVACVRTFPRFNSINPNQLNLKCLILMGHNLSVQKLNFQCNSSGEF